jgi:DnaK suppressor protein
MKRKSNSIKVRQVLIKRRDALRNSLGGDLGLLKSLEGLRSGDEIDAAIDSAQGELSSQLAEAESRELVSIENALARIDCGEYGTCENCGGKIPAARLQAVPYATRCIRCQREAERSRSSNLHFADWGRLSDPISNEPPTMGFQDIELELS